MATIKEISDRTGYSQAAVSRALSNDKSFSISQETRIKILSAAEELGYERKKGGKMAKKTFNIALVSYSSTFKNEIDSGYYFSMRSGIQDECEAQNISYCFLTAAELPKGKHAFDGAIIIGHLHRSDYDQILKTFKSKNIVAVNTVYYYPALIDHVAFDNRLCTELALRHILENGHRKIGYVGHYEFEDMERFGSRIAAFRNILQGEGLLNERWIHECQRGVEEGYRCVKDWVDSTDDLPTALFCANDPVAIGALKALYQKGLDVPRDISIVSVDGSFITKFSNPPITSVDVHTYELGQEGVRRLLERMKGERSIVVQVNLTPTLVVRDSLCSVLPPAPPAD